MAITRIKTWTQEILTHTDLNAEFDNIINNLTITNIGDYSANASEMRATVDPYPASSESLATDASGELARLRYVIAQITGKTYWYQDPSPTLTDIISLLGMTATVGTNSLTVTLTDKGGSALSASNTVSIPFRSATLGSGVQVVRSVATSTSIVLSAGSTLGFVADEVGKIYVYAIDNAGTVELALSKSPLFKASELITTTAEGGSGAADSSFVLYSTTARTDVACKCIGYLEIQTGSTAGNWSSNPTTIHIFGSGEDASLSPASVSFIAQASTSITGLAPGVRYKVSINFIQNTTAGLPYLQFNTDTGANYHYQGLAATDASTNPWGVNSGATYIVLMEQNMAVGYSYTGEFSVITAQADATKTFVYGDGYFERNASSVPGRAMFGGMYDGAANLSSMEFIVSAGTATGTISVYQE